MGAHMTSIQRVAAAAIGVVAVLTASRPADAAPALSQARLRLLLDECKTLALAGAKNRVRTVTVGQGTAAHPVTVVNLGPAKLGEDDAVIETLTNKSTS